MTGMSLDNLDQKDEEVVSIGRLEDVKESGYEGLQFLVSVEPACLVSRQLVC
jgi:hypothetical protein